MLIGRYGMARGPMEQGLARPPMPTVRAFLTPPISRCLQRVTLGMSSRVHFVDQNTSTGMLGYFAASRLRDLRPLNSGLNISTLSITTTWAIQRPLSHPEDLVPSPVLLRASLQSARGSHSYLQSSSSDRRVVSISRWAALPTNRGAVF